MNLSHVERLGIAVRGVEEALPSFGGVLRLTCYNTGGVANQKVRTVFLKIGEVELKLLKPMSDESPITKFIERHDEGIHHLALSSDDVAPALEELKGKGIRLTDEKPRKDAEGLNITFVHSKSVRGVLLEICGYRDVAK